MLTVRAHDLVQMGNVAWLDNHNKDIVNNGGGSKISLGNNMKCSKHYRLQ